MSTAHRLPTLSSFVLWGSEQQDASKAEAVGNQACSTSEADAPICRLCWQEEDQEQGGRLFSPCACSGTLKYIHERYGTF